MSHRLGRGGGLTDNNEIFVPSAWLPRGFAQLLHQTQRFSRALLEEVALLSQRHRLRHRALPPYAQQHARVSSLKRARNAGSAVVLTSLRLCSEMLKLRDALPERREFVCASR